VRLEGNIHQTARAGNGVSRVCRVVYQQRQLPLPAPAVSTESVQIRASLKNSARTFKQALQDDAARALQ